MFMFWTHDGYSRRQRPAPFCRRFSFLGRPGCANPVCLVHDDRCKPCGVKRHALEGRGYQCFFPRAAVWINLVGDIISLIYAVIVCYFMWTYIQNMMEFPQYFSAIPWLSATVMYIPGVIGMAGFCVRICQGSIIPTIKMIRNRSCSEDSGASGK